MTPSGSGKQRRGEPNPLRRILGSTFLVLALGLLAVATLVTYGLTREYGYSPNDDPVQDLRPGAPQHRRLLTAAGARAAGGADTCSV